MTHKIIPSLDKDYGLKSKYATYVFETNHSKVNKKIF